MKIQHSHFWRRGYPKTVVGTIFVLCYLFPVYWMVTTSLKSDAAIFATPPKLFPIPPEFKSYVTEVIHNPKLILAITNSAIIGLGTMILTLLLAVPGAYALARMKLRGGSFVMLVLLVSQLLPSIVIAGPLFISFSRINLLNSHLALILADTTITLPFSVIVLRPFFLTFPQELESAARVDGCTQLGVLWRIVLPYVRPGIITIGAFNFLIAWGEFVFALAINTNQNQPITVILNKFIGQYGTQWNNLMAVSTVAAHHHCLCWLTALYRQWIDGWCGKRVILRYIQRHKGGDVKCGSGTAAWAFAGRAYLT